MGFCGQNRQGQYGKRDALPRQIAERGAGAARVQPTKALDP
jgi:hypothetical protein